MTPVDAIMTALDGGEARASEVIDRAHRLAPNIDKVRLASHLRVLHDTGRIGSRIEAETAIFRRTA